jgi:hypothetical protein
MRHLERGFEAVSRGHAFEMELPSWWTYPAQCANGHVWGPGRVTIGWTSCLCAERKPGAGHIRVHCREPGCDSTWYDPPHRPIGDGPNR